VSNGNEAGPVIEPLRKRKLGNGPVYTRPAKIEELLRLLVALPPDEAIAERLGAPRGIVVQQLLDALMLPEIPAWAAETKVRPLNGEQRDAAHHRGSAYLLEAGPGTGKTQTQRVARGDGRRRGMDSHGGSSARPGRMTSLSANRSLLSRGAKSLSAAIEMLLGEEAARDALIELTISSSEAATNAHGLASLSCLRGGTPRTAWFVSRDAVSLAVPGAEATFDRSNLQAGIARSLTFNRRFFESLARAIKRSSMTPAPPAGDGSEYDAAEAADARRRALGVTNRSRFLSVGVDTQVTWPRHEMLVEFDRYRLVPRGGFGLSIS
jgi:hypothetical protein